MDESNEPNAFYISIACNCCKIKKDIGDLVFYMGKITCVDCTKEYLKVYKNSEEMLDTLLSVPEWIERKIELIHIPQAEDS
jgi:hypothetical protein